MDLTQTIEAAKSILESDIRSWQKSATPDYFIHCQEQASDAMIRMLESNVSIYQFTYLCLVDIRTHKIFPHMDGTLPSVRKVPGKEFDREWDCYMVVPYTMIVHAREICLNDIYRRIIDNRDSGVFLCFGNYDKWFENSNDIQESEDNEIKW